MKQRLQDIKKKYTKILPIVLSFSLLTGCTNSFSKTKNKETNEAIETTTVINDLPQEKMIIIKQKEIIDSLQKRISDLLQEKMIRSLREKEILEKLFELINQPEEYTYDDIYDPSEFMQELPNFSNEVNHDKTIDTENFYSSDLSQIIRKNNQKFNVSEANTKYYTLENYDDLELEMISLYILDYLKSEIKNVENYDYNNLFCNIKNLKLYKGYSKIDPFVKGMFDDEELVLIIFEDNILNEYLKLSNLSEVKDAYDFKNFRYKTIYHEVYHLLQDKCDHIDNNYSLFGMSIRKGNESSPFDFRYLEEAQAEINSGTPDTYYQARRMAELLKLSCLINPATKLADIDNITLYKNPVESLEKLGIMTREEQIRFIKMNTTFSIGDQEISGFLIEILERNGLDIENVTIGEVNEIFRSIKNESIIEMLRFFYKNLLDVNINNNISLEENLYLLKVLETKIDIQYFRSDREYEQNIVLYNKFKLYRDYMFNYLSNKYNEPLINIENTYKDNDKIKAAINKDSFSWLDNDKVLYLLNLEIDYFSFEQKIEAAYRDYQEKQDNKEQVRTLIP